MTDGGPGAHQHDWGARDVGEEARKLLGSVQEWARRAMPAPPSGQSDPQCQWCPVCRMASALRGEHPELTERVAEAGTAVLSALRSVVDAASARADAGPAAEPDAQPAPRVHHIRLDEPGADHE